MKRCLAALCIPAGLLSCGARSQMSVDAGNQILRGIRFPEAWSLPAAPGKSFVGQMPARFEVRRGAGGRGLLMRLLPEDGRQSVEVYRIEEGSSRPSPAGLEEWEAAQPEAASRDAFAAGSSGGPELKATGGTFGAALQAKSGRYVAVMSFSSDKKPSQSLPYLAGGEPSEGTIFLDLYETATGRKLAAGQAAYRGFGPRILFEQAAWFGERSFAMPLDYLAQTCFVAEISGP